MGLDTVEFVLWSEQEFEIEIPDRDSEIILTVGQYSAYIHYKLLDIHGTNTISEAEIFERLKQFLVSGFKIAPGKVTRDSYFVKDLKLDQ